MKDITFVDDDDNVIGSGTKQEAWEKGIYHRIARVFLFNSRGELLIQKRSDTMASNPGKWDQSAAGHVDAGEDYLTAARRELEEEAGIVGVTLTEKGKLKINEDDEVDKIKKRFNMVYTGVYDGEIKHDPKEVSETRWIDPDELEALMDERPSDFTGGFIQHFKYLRNLSDTV